MISYRQGMFRSVLVVLIERYWDTARDLSEHFYVDFLLSLLYQRDSYIGNTRNPTAE